MGPAGPGMEKLRTCPTGVLNCSNPACLRILARFSATSSPRDISPSPINSIPRSNSCVVGSRMLPSMITWRPAMARRTGVGICGVAAVLARRAKSRKGLTPQP
ncbi:Uncharacterised protein [Mycobacteroides abscessus subsp. abscessus]|nr:Uncharacterised protein [Mycobacteroides abscessus subsp. abscessus]SIM86055.1 Uncharacterised protein [Mycobacteroides abscessus subsp. abscessus]